MMMIELKPEKFGAYHDTHLVFDYNLYLIQQVTVFDTSNTNSYSKFFRDSFKQDPSSDSFFHNPVFMSLRYGGGI